MSFDRRLHEIMHLRAPFVFNSKSAYSSKSVVLTDYWKAARCFSTNSATDSGLRPVIFSTPSLVPAICPRACISATAEACWVRNGLRAERRDRQELVGHQVG